MGQLASWLQPPKLLSVMVAFYSKCLFVVIQIDKEQVSSQRGNMTLHCYYVTTSIIPMLSGWLNDELTHVSLIQSPPQMT